MSSLSKNGDGFQFGDEIPSHQARKLSQVYDNGFP